MKECLSKPTRSDGMVVRWRELYRWCRPDAAEEGEI